VEKAAKRKFSGARKMVIRLAWDQETLGAEPRRPTTFMVSVA